MSEPHPMPVRHWWALLIAALGPLLLTGCLSRTIPSQSHPSCSWTSQPPADADALCKATFTTLRRVLEAGIREDAATLEQLVPDAGIRGKIARFGKRIHDQGDISVHITPSFTLERAPDGSLGAGFNLVGTTRQGVVKAPQTVYLARREGRQVVIGDQPDEEW